LSTEEPKSKNWEEKVDTVPELATHFPSRDLAWVGFTLEVICSTMEPMSKAINVMFFKVSELIKWMML